MRLIHTIALSVSIILAALFLFAHFQIGVPLTEPILHIGATTEQQQKTHIISKDNPLPETITEDIGTGQHFITGTVTIPPDTNIHIADDARIYADMDARILVKGSLSANDIVLKSNDLYPNEKIWHGIMISKGGDLSLTNSSISHATAGISCAGTGTINNNIFSYNTVGAVLLPEGTCSIRGGRMEYGRVGILALGQSPTAEQITFHSIEDEIRTDALR